MKRRREFITLLGGAAAWPIAARAQQRERIRRIGVLLPAPADDADFQAWLGAFQQTLAQSGWIIGRNIRIDVRWTEGNAEKARRYAAELVALAPDVILAHGTSTIAPLLQVTRTVPIIFPVAGDPVGAGLVDSLAHPGGNFTGFMTVEYSFAGKWLELLKQIAPGRGAGGSPAGCQSRLGNRPVCRDPGNGTVTWGGGDSGQCARRV